MKRILLFLAIIGCGGRLAAQKNNTAPGPRPFVLGYIEELPSKILAEKRELNIYLPEGYDPADTVRYPVVYLLDGSADEDFIHIAGLAQFSNFSWVNWLPKSIIVGIANTNRRRDFYFKSSVPSDMELSPAAGGSANFMAFIEQELQPFIDQRYKTSRQRTLIGQSAGGLFAVNTLFTKPQLFNRYIIVSPALWWDDGSILKRKPAVLDSAFQQPTEIYLAVGKEGLAPCPGNHVMEVDANLLAEMLANTKSRYVNTFFDYLPQENHGTTLHQAVLNAFRVFSRRQREQPGR